MTFNILINFSYSMMKFLKKLPTFLFYDYETFGIRTDLDRPSQFACIRTDINFNIIEDPECFYSFPSDDYLPDPNSVLITKITPQYTKKYGTNEYNFTKRVFNILKNPNTCIIGYNNIHFDDEITRNIFYRNFFDPYEWSWKNGNSRWDLLNVLRACYALRPEGIKWPRNNLGLVNFKLSEFTKINNISHSNIHDALSDVYATIEVAKLIKKKQPKLFDFFFKNRKKNELKKLINLKKLNPIFYVSSFFGAIRHNISCIVPIVQHKNNQNIFISIDLYKNIKKLIQLCQNISLHKDLIKNLFDAGIVFLHVNRCPILSPINVIRLEDAFRLNIDIELYNKKVCFLQKHKNIFKNIQIIFSKENYSNISSNVDTQIYNSFFNEHDKRIIKIIQNTQPIDLKNIIFDFHDARLKDLFFRYRARNFFYTLDVNEKKIWIKYCLNIFNSKDFKKYKNKIKVLLKEYRSNKTKIFLLNSLLKYANENYAKLFHKNANLN